MKGDLNGGRHGWADPGTRERELEEREGRVRASKSKSKKQEQKATGMSPRLSLAP